MSGNRNSVYYTTVSRLVSHSGHGYGTIESGGCRDFRSISSEDCLARLHQQCYNAPEVSKKDGDSASS